MQFEGSSECHSPRSWRLDLGIHRFGSGAWQAIFTCRNLPAASVHFAMAPELFLPHTHIRGKGEGDRREREGRRKGRKKGRKERRKKRERKEKERKEKQNETKRKEKKRVHLGSRKRPA